MKTLLKTIIFLSLLFFIPFLSKGQGHSHDHQVKLGGSFGLWADYYFSNIEPNDPFSEKRPKHIYRLSFNPTLTTGHWSFSTNIFILSKEPRFSDINKGFLSDYRNNLGLSIKYEKQLEFKFGRITPKTSKLVSTNIPLSGVGFIMDRKKIGISFYYGHTGKPNEEDMTLNIMPKFRRNYYVGSIRLGNKNKSNFGINILYAGDKENSILKPESMTPKENLVASINSRIKLGKSAYLKWEAASSLYTNNVYLPNDSINTPKVLDKISNYNESTRFGYATSANIGSKGKKLDLDIGVKYYSAEYNTLGTFFQQNDFLDILFSLNLKLWKNKFILRTSSGVRFKQLEQNKMTGSNNSQFIGNYNLSLTPNNTFSISAYYTNFNLSIEDGTERYMYNQDDLMVDTIQGYKIKMTSHSMGFTPSFNLGKQKKHRLFLSINMNTFRNADVFTNNFSSENTTRNISLGYNHNKGKFNYGINTGYFIGKGVQDINYFHITPNANLKILKNKLNLRTSIKWAKNKESNSNESQINGRIGVKWKITKKINYHAEVIQNIYKYDFVNNIYNINETRFRTSLRIKL